MKNPIIVIAGPTASGKTAMAVKLAKKFKGEIINADSRTLYKEMDVATSKPTVKEMGNAPHHLFDIVSPDQEFTLADYKKLARTAIAEVQSKGKIPIIVGGTGLYIDSIIYDFNFTESVKDQKLREELDKLPTDKLVEKLEDLDPTTIEQIDTNNRRRLIRAIEVVTLTEKSFFEQQERSPKPHKVLYLAIDIPREDLYKKINNRIDEWEKDNKLVLETRKLMEKYSLNLPSMSSIGYKEIAEAISGKITLNEALEIMKKRTRNYAKRQLTWFRRNHDIIWVKNQEEASNKISKFINS